MKIKINCLLTVLVLLCGACAPKPLVVDGQGLPAALAEVKDGGAIVVTPGTYDFYPEDGTDMWLNSAGVRSGVKHVLFPIVGKKNVTIDGSGSKLIIHGDAFPFYLCDCQGVTLKNFVIASAYPSTLGLKLTEKDATGFTAEIIGDACPFDITPNGNAEFHLEGRELRTQDGRISTHALDRLAIQYLMTEDGVGNKDEFPAQFSGVRWSRPDDRTLRFDYYGDTHYKSGEIMYGVGETFVVNLEERRYRCSLFLENTDDVTVKDIRITRMGGMGMVAQMCGNLTIDGYTVWPEVSGSVTTTADMMYIVCCYGNLTIRNCQMSGSLDDAINIHGMYLALQSQDDDWLTLVTQHETQTGFFFYRKGDRIEIVEPHTRDIYATATVEELVEDEQNPHVCRIRIADLQTVGGHVVTGGLLVENTTLHAKVLLEDNHFECYPHIRLSGRGGITVRHNTMKNACAAVLCDDLAPYWGESGRISTLTIEDNNFIDCNKMGGSNFITVGVSGWGADAPQIHDSVIIRRNHVEGIVGGLVSLSGVKHSIVE